jgi:hypothetical protein
MSEDDVRRAGKSPIRVERGQSLSDALKHHSNRGGTEQITIRLPQARVQALRAKAKAEHRSLAQQVEHQLAASDATPPPPKPEAAP